MLLITLLSIISGNSFIGVSSTYEVNTDAIVNGSTSTFDINQASLTFSIDPLQGALVWIVIIVALGVAIGIKVLGSGLSDQSVHLLFMGTFFISIWTILSVLASGLIFEIEVFGSLIYITLTILYAIGCIMFVSGGGGGSEGF